MLIHVRVKPGSSVDKVEKVGEDFVVFVRAPAQDGKANSAVVKLLAREFGVSTKDVKIKTFKGRKKIVEIVC